MTILSVAYFPEKCSANSVAETERFLVSETFGTIVSHVSTGNRTSYCYSGVRENV